MAKTNVTLAVLNLTDFNFVLDQFPEFRQHVKTEVEIRRDQNRSAWEDPSLSLYSQGDVDDESLQRARQSSNPDALFSPVHRFDEIDKLTTNGFTEETSNALFPISKRKTSAAAHARTDT